MRGIRQLVQDRSGLAALLLALALFLKMLVPQGYMPAPVDTGVIVALCSGTMPEGSTITISIPKKGGQHDATQSMADQPCAFSALSDALTHSDFAVLALAALAFVFVLAIIRAPLALPSSGAQIRPPSQGPPLIS